MTMVNKVNLRLKLCKLAGDIKKHYLGLIISLYI